MIHIQKYKFFGLKVLILHGYGASVSDCFYEWLGKELTKLGCEVSIPSLPSPDNPNDMDQARSISGNYDMIIAHSFGCPVAMKYITLSNYKIKHLILLSGFIDNNFYPEDPDIEGLKNSSNWEFEFDEIKSKCENIHILYPTIDTSVTKDQIDQLSTELDSKTTILDCEEDHFCGNTEPEILKFILTLN